MKLCDFEQYGTYEAQKTDVQIVLMVRLIGGNTFQADFVYLINWRQYVSGVRSIVSET